ncbi:hypothetical protein HOF92_15390 [bacterium]|jgi:hypothetical protein|nr:hypothetical protein [bacterium]
MDSRRESPLYDWMNFFRKELEPRLKKIRNYHGIDGVEPEKIREQEDYVCWFLKSARVWMALDSGLEISELKDLGFVLRVESNRIHWDLDKSSEWTHDFRPVLTQINNGVRKGSTLILEPV